MISSCGCFRKWRSFRGRFRFTAGDRLTVTGIDLLMLLVEAAYSSNKDKMLEEANRKINGIRYLLRLSKDLRLLAVDSMWRSAQ